jgi:hydrogenase/urease nickel incorporation metallochaperone HypA
MHRRRQAFLPLFGIAKLGLRRKIRRFVGNGEELDATGEFTTIVREALEFAFEIARRETLAANAKLEIEIVPMALRCAVCGPVTNPGREMCLLHPQCGLPLEIVSRRGAAGGVY